MWALKGQTSNAGLEKVSSGCPGQVNFPCWQVTFHSHLPDGQEIRQLIHQLKHKKSKLWLV